MGLSLIKAKSTWMAAIKAPLIPSALFVGMYLAGLSVYTGISGTMGMKFLSGVSSSVLVATIYVFVTTYVVGLIITILLGVFVGSVLPDEIPVISALNRRPVGRIFLAFMVLLALSFIGLGITGGTFILALLCLGEYARYLPDRPSKAQEKQGLFY